MALGGLYGDVVYQALVNGTTGGTEPEWDALAGATLLPWVIDNDLVWLLVGQVGGAPLVPATMILGAMLAGLTTPVVAHGSMGSTETFDYSYGTFQSGTYTADCALTLTGWPTSGTVGILTLIIDIDGTGGYAVPTFGAEVVNAADLAAVWDSTAGARNVVVLLTVDAGTTVYIVGLPAAGGAAVGASLQRTTRTAGSITLAAVQNTPTEASTAFRLTIPAAVGDVLQIGLSAVAVAGASGEGAIDSATIVSGSIVNQVSPGSAAPLAVGHGWFGTSPASVNGTLTYVVQSGDISAGSVTVSLTYTHTSAATGTLYATTAYAVTYWVLNLGH